MCIFHRHRSPIDQLLQPIIHCLFIDMIKTLNNAIIYHHALFVSILKTFVSFLFPFSISKSRYFEHGDGPEDEVDVI